MTPAAKKKEGTAEAGPLRVRAIWPDYAEGYAEVEDTSATLGTFYVRRNGAVLLYSFREVETVDLLQLLDPEEWDREYGGLCSYGELEAAINAAMK